MGGGVPVAVAVGVGDAVAVAVAVGVGAGHCCLITIETLPEEPLATARSCLPSPLKSPTATESGLEPVGKSIAALKLPSPLPNKIDTVFESELVTARSCLPSLLKSPTAIESG